MGPININVKLPDIEKVKTHFREKKQFYAGVGIGAGAGALFVLGVHRRPIQIINNIAPVIAPIFHNNNSSKVKMGGYITKGVLNTLTGESWTSVTKAAQAAGVPIEVMSKHLNHYPGYEDIKGVVYTLVGIGTNMLAA